MCNVIFFTSVGYCWICLVNKNKKDIDSSNSLFIKYIKLPFSGLSPIFLSSIVENETSFVITETTLLYLALLFSM